MYCFAAYFLDKLKNIEIKHKYEEHIFSRFIIITQREWKGYYFDVYTNNILT